MVDGEVPDRGDLVWLDFTPQSGREQAGRRPGLVLSPASYNGRSSLCLICPITNRVKGYPFEVLLPEGLGIEGAILSDHLRSVDWRARQAEKVGSAPKEIVDEVVARIGLLLNE